MKKQNPAARFAFVVTLVTATILGSTLATAAAPQMPSLDQRLASLERDHAAQVEVLDEAFDGEELARHVAAAREQLKRAQLRVRMAEALAQNDLPAARGYLEQLRELDEERPVLAAAE